MGASWLRGRAGLRLRWRAAVVLALITAVGGGVALTALAGARRTDSAISQFVKYSLPDDGGFVYGSPVPRSAPPASAGASEYSTALSPTERKVVGLPLVAAWFRLPQLNLFTDPAGRSSVNLQVMASPDADFFHRVDRPLVLAGRLPSLASTYDAAVNPLAARDLHVAPGDLLHLYAKGPSSQPVDFSLRVTGIFRLPADVNAVEPYTARQNVSYEAKDEIYLPPPFVSAFSRRTRQPVQSLADIDIAAVRLRHGVASYPAYASAATKAGGGQIFVGNAGNVLGTDTTLSSATRATRLQALSLLVFGLVALLITVLVVGQAVSRQVALDASDHAAMRALGATRSQLVGAAVVESGIAALLGAALAFAVAALASPLMPIGLARQAEIHRGFQVDLGVMLGGAALLAFVLLGWAAGPVLRSRSYQAATAGASSVAPSKGTSSFTAAIARLLRSPVAGMGVRFGLHRGAGGTSVPVVSALVAAVVTVAGIAASLTFGSSLSHLSASPREQGWNWDVLVGDPNDFANRESQYASVLARDPLVGSYSAIAVIAGARQGNAYVGRVALDTFLAFDELKGSVQPTLLHGRAPQGLHEIVFGTRTLAKLHKRVGDIVAIDVGPPVGTLKLRIVGAMIAPSVGDIFTNSLGDGAWISGSAFKAVQSQIPPDSNAGPPQSTFSLFAVRYARGAPPGAAFASLERRFGPVVLRRLPPEDLVNLHSVQNLPLVLAGLVGLLGLATVGHTLVTSVRRRRRDIALLKTVGFDRRQIAATVVWQATSFVVVALVIGLPLGVAAGRWAWHVVASGINSTSAPRVPFLAIALVVPVALVLANLLAAAPGWVAARIAPAVALRSD